MQSLLRPVLQTQANDCALACVATLLPFYGRQESFYQLKMQHPLTTAGLGVRELKQLMNYYELNARVFSVQPQSCTEAVLQQQLPCIAYLNRGHYVVVADCRDGQVLLLDPACGRSELSWQQFCQQWSGLIFSCDREPTPLPAAGVLAELRQLLPPMRAVRGFWLALAGLSLLLLLVSYGLPLLMSYSVNYTLQQQQFPWSLPVIALALGCYLLLIMLLNYGKQRFALEFKIKMDQWFNQQFFSRLVGLPIKFFSVFPHGDLLDRVSSATVLKEFITSRLPDAVIDVLVLTVMTTVILLISPKTGVLFLLLALACAYLIWRSWRVLGQRYRAEILAYAGMFEVLSDSLIGIMEAKVSQREPNLLQRINLSFAGYLQKMRERGLLTAWLDAIMQGLPLLVPVLMAFLSLWLVVQGELSPADALLAYLLVQFALPPLLSLSNTLLRLQNLLVHQERLAGISNFVQQQAPVAATTAGAPPVAYQLQQLDFSYAPNGKLVLQQISARLAGPGLIALTGPSGSGKSTLLKMLAGLYSPCSGHLQLLDAQDQQLPWEQAASQVASVLQDYVIFNATVLENLTLFSARPDLAAVEQACRQAAIHEEILQLPEGYHSRLGRNGCQISGGQRQRLALARALLQQPAILLLDEFSSHLDEANELKIINNLRQLPCLTIIATHRQGWLLPTDLRLRLEQGQVVSLSPELQLPEAVVRQEQNLMCNPSLAVKASSC